MKVELGKFARSGIESQLGPDLHAGALAALAHYMRRLKSEWTPIGPPAFVRGQAGDAEDSFELTLEAETQAALEQEAARHQVPVEQIVSHAVLTYLADIDGALVAAPAAAVSSSAASAL